MGVVEGVTEFLPISSTGHLILAGHFLGLDLKDPGVDAFLVVIQAGALLAVLGLYWPSIRLMLRGIFQRDPEGLGLIGLLLIAFFPAAVSGALFGKAIKERLFGPVPVALALGVGGIAMIALEAHRRRARLNLASPEPEDGAQSWKAVTWRMALVIGLAQCLALWPGTSRSMVTILAAMLVGLPPRSAAEFSFLLALPTLGAATAHDCLKDGQAILHSAGWLGLFLGFSFSCVVAAVAIKTFLAWLVRHGLGAFGWYRIVLAVIVLVVMRG